MYLGPYSDATWCKYFPTTLTGMAQAWFQKLPQHSVHNFAQLSQLFTDHFVSGRRREKTSVELMAIKQGKDETLRDFLGRFNKEAVSVSSIKPDVVILALQHGLQPGPYRDYLTRESVSSLAEALRISDKYIRSEEFNKVVSGQQTHKEADKAEKDSRAEKKRQKGKKSGKEYYTEN